VLGLLRRLDHRRLVEVALVVDVELAKGILQPENVRLLELRVFPARGVLLAGVEAGGGAWNGGIARRAAYLWILMMFMAGGCGVGDCGK
jgi:hypothetical protein